ncbi:hypothetical protein C8Q77DRAFT_1157587 [Trametes polyzona]|nr:hypothetical protein C8Q77DRAFT_1157587 [Trametes polyzona]
MRYSFAVLVVSLLPASYAAALLTTSVGAAIATASLPVVEVHALDLQVNFTHARGGIQIDTAQQTFPSDLLLCTALSCAGCTTFNIQGQHKSTCFNIENEFPSAAIVQPSNEGLPLAVEVGAPACTELAQLTAINTCFRLGSKFKAFELLS